MTAETTTMALAEALLRRKELQGLLTRLEPLKAQDYFVSRVQRKQVMEGVDEVLAQVPRITATEIDQYYNWLARQLRVVDAAIQRTNWEAQVSMPASAMAEYEPKPWPKDTNPNTMNR